MKLGAVIFATGVMFCIIIGIMMAASILSSQTISDTYGNQPSEQINTSQVLIGNVTAIGTTAGSGLLFLFAANLVIGAIAFLIVYGKYK